MQAYHNCGNSGRLMRRKGQRGETAYRNTTSRSRNIIAFCLGARRPLCDVIPNGVLQISVVREAGKSSFTCCTAALSNVQKNTVGGNPHNTVLKRRLYPLAFEGYSAWRRRRIGRRRKRRNPQTAKNVFYALAPFHLKERLAFVCVQRTLSTSLFHLPLLVSVES